MSNEADIRQLVELYVRLGSSQGPLAQLVLEGGVFFEGRTRSQDVEVADAWRKKYRPRIKRCFQNAQMFCLDSANSCLGERARYFEGYAFTSGGIASAFHHAWNVMPDGHLIDFTLEAAYRQAKENRETLYLGIEVPWRTVLDTMQRKRAIEPILPDLIRQPWMRTGVVSTCGR